MPCLPGRADTIHEAIFRAQGFGKFADHCKEEADEELEEAKKCTARVVALGFVLMMVLDVALG